MTSLLAQLPPFNPSSLNGLSEGDLHLTRETFDLEITARALLTLVFPSTPAWRGQRERLLAHTRPRGYNNHVLALIDHLRPLSLSPEEQDELIQAHWQRLKEQRQKEGPTPTATRAANTAALLAAFRAKPT